MTASGLENRKADLHHIRSDEDFRASQWKISPGVTEYDKLPRLTHN